MPHAARGATLQIGELAERTGLSQRTIRHYDEVGLLPASRTGGGFRVYTETDVHRLGHIKAMKPLGFTLEEMAELLDLLTTHTTPTGAGTTDTPAGTSTTGTSTAGAGTVDERLAGYLDRARPERDKLARKLTQADEFITLLEHHLHP
ncbi:MerR family transcriptional regulator [Kocuria sp. M1N1S27]|uniref:MerR family transcriptional regulator n=1 Tax=Kocuria kalidii TaxID=3376283 RepID=UPI0037ADDEC4